MLKQTGEPHVSALCALVWFVYLHVKDPVTTFNIIQLFTIQLIKHTIAFIIISMIQSCIFRYTTCPHTTIFKQSITTASVTHIFWLINPRVSSFHAFSHESLLCCDKGTRDCGCLNTFVTKYEICTRKNYCIESYLAVTSLQQLRWRKPSCSFEIF